MANRNTSKLLSDLSIVLEGLENDFFEEGTNKMYYNGIEFTRGDWRNLQRAVEHVKKYYDSNLESTKKYLRNNKEYNRTMRMINYYRNKPIKKDRDFTRLEMLEKKRDKLAGKMDEKEKIRTKIKWLQKENERKKRIEERKERSLEDEFRYRD